MLIIDYFTSTKKIFHYLIEYNNVGGKILFAFPTILDIDNFQPILKYLQKKFINFNMYSGLIETIKNREQYKDYIFINFLNMELLKEYTLVFKLPEILDYNYFIPNLIGLTNIPNIDMKKSFNYLIDYYDLKNYIVFYINEKDNINEFVNLIYFLKDKNYKYVLMGDSINCIELTYLIEENPVIIFKKDKLVVLDLIKQANIIIGNIDPNFKYINYNFIELKDVYNRIQ